MESRETVGKLSTLILNNEPNTHSAHEQMQEQLGEYDKNFWIAFDAAKATYPSGDFYIEIITKKEPLMQNVLRNYFLTKRACPTPTWDQAVHRYNHANQTIEFLWVVPDKRTCAYFMANADSIPREEYHLCNFVHKFENGELLKEAKQLNGEQPDSPFLLGVV